VDAPLVRERPFTSVRVREEQDMDTALRDRPMGDLAKRLSQDVSELVRRELELAKAEMAIKGLTPSR
jgi:hypothetical protein